MKCKMNNCQRYHDPHIFIGYGIYASAQRRSYSLGQTFCVFILNVFVVKQTILRFIHKLD